MRGGGGARWPSGLTHPVGVLVVAAVLREGTFCALSQEDLGANVAVTGGAAAEDGTQRHVTGGGGERTDRAGWCLSWFHGGYVHILNQLPQHGFTS